MAYRHGVYTREIPTRIVPPVRVDCGLPVVFGTAPINKAIDPAETNRPYLIFSYEEAVKKFGFSEDWKNYSLSEMIYSQFALYGMAPIVLINVLDPKKHMETGNGTFEIVRGKGQLKVAGVIPESLKIKGKSGTDEFKLAEDYIIEFENTNDFPSIIVTSEKMVDGTYTAEFDRITPEKITKKEIIGGIDGATNKKTGLELVSEVYPRFGLVPGLIAAPGYSGDSEVAAIMETKAARINGVFKADALIDLDADKNYDEVSREKNIKNFVSTHQFVCYPKVGLGDKVYHLSTHMIGVINQTDYANGDVPYVSPSNKMLKVDKTIMGNKERLFGLEEANYLNGQGVVTALNFSGGWRLWGNRTGAYPSNTDIKDAFIPIRRMFNWVANTLVLTFWNKVDNPMNKRSVETIIDSANLWLNGLVAQGCLYGARVKVLTDENPITDLMDGIIRFHVYMTPPAPMRQIEFIQEYNVEYLSTFVETIAAL